MMEWQPIETAPKDGTWILTWTKDIEHDWSPFLVVRWYHGEWIIEEGTFYDPTHWMPLPDPPKADE